MDTQKNATVEEGHALSRPSCLHPFVQFTGCIPSEKVIFGRILGLFDLENVWLLLKMALLQTHLFSPQGYKILHLHMVNFPAMLNYRRVGGVE